MVYLIYVIIGIVLAVRLYTGRFSILWPQFFKRLLYILPIFIVISLLIFIIDFAVTSDGIIEACSQHRYLLPFPIVPFSIADVTAASQLAVLISLGVLPTVLAMLFTAVNRPYSRIILILVIIGTVASTWTHFLLYTTDERRWNRAVISGSHVYLSGELETLLLENQEKVQQANPEIMKSDNSDLKKFISEHQIEFDKK
jgi:hypothetical protein